MLFLLQTKVVQSGIHGLNLSHQGFWFGPWDGPYIFLVERKRLLFVPKRFSDIEGEGDFHSFHADDLKIRDHKQPLTQALSLALTHNDSVQFQELTFWSRDDSEASAFIYLCQKYLRPVKPYVLLNRAVLENI